MLKPLLKVQLPQETVSLSCRGAGFSFDQRGMHWIKQSEGKAMEWLGLIYYDASKTIYAASVQGRIEITRDNSNKMVYLRLSNLKPEDSAVYYCAAAHTVVCVNIKASQKPQKIYLYKILQRAADLKLFTSTKEVMFLFCQGLFVCLSVCLSVSVQHNSKSYGQILMKFSGFVGNGIRKK
uniref:Ig-like domain-containing protein n=1 Tax=Sphaeramia orbicularis TaxID=375764 RepID=A0A672Y3X4_9TELE